MSALIRFFACGYLFFSSWTDAFALNPWLPLPNLIAFLSLALFVAHRRGRIVFSALKKEDFFLLLLVCAVTVSAIAHPNDKTINYLLAYFVTFFMLYLLMKQLFVSEVSAATALGINTIGVMVTAFFVVFIEFVPKIFFDFDIQPFMFRQLDADAAYLGLIPRAYGFSTEPTNLGFYLDTLGLVGLWHFRVWAEKRRLLRWSGSVLFVGAWLATLSAAALIALPAAALLAAILLRQWRCFRPSVLNALLVSLVAGGLYIGFNLASDAVDDFASPLVYKVLLEETAEDSRPQRWKRDWALIEKTPLLGQGPGSSSTLRGSGGSVNWYLFLTLESGLIALLPALIFLFLSLTRIVQTPMRSRYVFTIGFIAAMIHLAAVSRFYDPFPWLLLILFYTVAKFEQDKISVDIHS